jgi:hypothetical protein
MQILATEGGFRVWTPPPGHKSFALLHVATEQLCGLPSHLLTVSRGYFPGVKRPVREVDRSPASGAELSMRGAVRLLTVCLRAVGRATLAYFLVAGDIFSLLCPLISLRNNIFMKISWEWSRWRTLETGAAWCHASEWQTAARFARAGWGIRGVECWGRDLNGK